MIGLEAQKRFFLEAIAAGSLAHSYCLVGPEGIGKRTLANEIAAVLLATEVRKVANHPNYLYVARLEDEKTGKLKKEISVSQARELKAALAGSSWGGGNRFVIIDDAELLNAEASNALLKVLEEPPTHTCFFLLTNNDRLLLPTIASRVQTLSLPLVPDAQIEAYLLQAGASPEKAKAITHLAWGRPGRAETLWRDTEKLSWYEAELQRWNELQNAPLYKKIALVESLYGDKDDAVRGRELLQAVLELWMMLARQEVLRGSTSYAILIDTFARGKELLGKNVHPRLIIENILVKF